MRFNEKFACLFEMNTNIQLKHKEIFDFVCLSSKINDKVISSFTVIEFINLHVKISFRVFQYTYLYKLFAVCIFAI